MKEAISHDKKNTNHLFLYDHEFTMRNLLLYFHCSVWGHSLLLSVNPLKFHLIRIVKTAKNWDVNTRPLADPFACLLTLLTHLLAPHCLLRLRAALRSFIRSPANFIHSQARENVGIFMSHDQAVLNHSAATLDSVHANIPSSERVHNCVTDAVGVVLVALALSVILPRKCETRRQHEQFL